jgi:SPP1 gp7 family putative phage head morphogenesis protein
MALSQKKIDEIYRGIHSGAITIETLPDELSAYTYGELIKFVENGFGPLDNALKIGKMELYNGNISAFSGAKTFQEVKDLTNFVFNEDGSKRKFSEFKKFAGAINDKYNKVWLKTEQDTAFGVAQGADKWMDFEQDKELFPMLQYQTASDERVRHEHAAWDGLTFPVDHSFWDTRMPVNGFNCRCTVIKLTEGTKSSLKGVPKNSSDQFSNNPGKVDYIFDPEKHPYFSHTKAEGPAFERSITWASRE